MIKNREISLSFIHVTYHQMIANKLTWWHWASPCKINSSSKVWIRRVDRLWFQRAMSEPYNNHQHMNSYNMNNSSVQSKEMRKGETITLVVLVHVKFITFLITIAHLYPRKDNKECLRIKLLFLQTRSSQKWGKLKHKGILGWSIQGLHKILQSLQVNLAHLINQMVERIRSHHHSEFITYLLSQETFTRNNQMIENKKL